MSDEMTPAATHYAIRTPAGGNLCYPIRPGFPVPDGADLLVPMSAVAALIARNTELEALADERLKGINTWAATAREWAEQASRVKRELDHARAARAETGHD